MIVDIHTFPNILSFLDKTQQWLEAREAFNNLLLGIALRLYDHPDWYVSTPYLATAETLAGDILLAVLWTPPRNLIIAGDDQVPQEAVNALVHHLKNHLMNPGGVHGASALSGQFSESWAGENGLAYHVSMHQRLYELRHLRQVAYSPGYLRVAKEADKNLVAQWKADFQLEAFGQDSPADAKSAVARQIAAAEVYIWEDGEPVSIAVRTRPTRHGVTVSGVYTPPPLRRKGYATSCVAALSQLLLSEGKQFLTLFTDLSNPTSNGIYSKIGYLPLEDFTLYHFEMPENFRQGVTGSRV